MKEITKLKNDVKKFLDDYRNKNDYYCLTLDRAVKIFPIKEEYTKEDVKEYMITNCCTIINPHHIIEFLNDNDWPHFIQNFHSQLFPK